MFFYRFLSLTNLFNNVPIKTVLEANVKCHAAVRWNVVTSILAAPNNFFSRKSCVDVRTLVFVSATRFSGASLFFFSNFSFTPFFILVYSLTSANLLRAWNDVRFIIVTKWCNDSLVGYSKILHAKEVV